MWHAGDTIRLFALRDETVALQVAIEGPAAEVSVEVELPGISSERFIEWFLPVTRSSSQGQNYSLAWAAGSGPRGDDDTGWLPDPLIPVEHAAAWAPWPMKIAAGENGVVWIDLTVPRDQPPGVVAGQVVVKSGAQILARFPVELEVLPATLPPRPVGTWVFYNREELTRAVAGDTDAAERQLLQLYHRHRVTAFDSLNAPAQVAARVPALDGSLYTPAAGYHGPAEGSGDGLIVLGTYGTLQAPNEEGIKKVEEISDALAARGLFDKAEVVLYAADERCDSQAGAGWRARIAQSKNSNVKLVRVTWTCSEPPAQQPVDVPMVFAGEYDSSLAAAARAAGKETWIYNGFRPSTGAMLTDTEAVSMRTFGWIAAMAQIPRWFIWESTAWFDSNPGGRGAFDPFADAATCRGTSNGVTLMGDGVLVYPGRQRAFAAHSLDFDGVIPSIRLKNLRRGIEDAGYLQLARSSNPDAADALARALFPRILAETMPGDTPSWSRDGRAFLETRRALSKMIGPGAIPRAATHIVGAGNGRPRVPRFRWRYVVLAFGGLMTVDLLLLAFSRRRKLSRG
jgi:hypothetical protein